MVSERLPVVIDPNQRRLDAKSRRRPVSIGRVVGTASDSASPCDAPTRRAAADDILRAEPMPVPATTDELRQELDEFRGGGR